MVGLLLSGALGGAQFFTGVSAVAESPAGKQQPSIIYLPATELWAMAPDIVAVQRTEDDMIEVLVAIHVHKDGERAYEVVGLASLERLRYFRSDHHRMMPRTASTTVYVIQQKPEANLTAARSLIGLNDFTADEAAADEVSLSNCPGPDTKQEYAEVRRTNAAGYYQHRTYIQWSWVSCEIPDGWDSWLYNRAGFAYSISGDGGYKERIDSRRVRGRYWTRIRQWPAHEWQIGCVATANGYGYMTSSCWDGAPN